MEAMSSDTRFRIPCRTFPNLQNLLMKSSRGREINEFFLLRQMHPNVFKILVEYDSNYEYRNR
jgi:DNA polymerase I-like protein with 3'-5' exonuclease and polymerase domains